MKEPNIIPSTLPTAPGLPRTDLPGAEPSEREELAPTGVAEIDIHTGEVVREEHDEDVDRAR